MSIVLLQISGVTVISGIVFLTLVVVLYLVAKAVMRWLDNYKNRQGQ